MIDMGIHLRHGKWFMSTMVGMSFILSFRLTFGMDGVRCSIRVSRFGRRVEHDGDVRDDGIRTSGRQCNIVMEEAVGLLSCVEECMEGDGEVGG